MVKDPDCVFTPLFTSFCRSTGAMNQFYFIMVFKDIQFVRIYKVPVFLQ